MGMQVTRVFHSAQPNLWVGRPRTAQYVIPNVGMLRIGDVEPQSTPDVSPRGRIRIRNASLNVVTSATAGFAVLYPDSIWRAGQWDDSAAGNDYTDDTTDAQDAAADDFALFTTTNNDGFVVLCRQPFNVLSVDQSTASGGSPVLEWSYWGDPVTGLAGTDAFQTITPLVSMTAEATQAERLIVLPIPLTAQGDQPCMQLSTASSPGEGIPAGFYVVRCRATTAPTTTGGSAARLYVGRTLHWQTSVGANTVLSLNQGSQGGIVEDAVGFGGFVATTHANNGLYVEYE